MITQMLFPIKTECLYHGSMTEHHGDAKVWGPLEDKAYRIYINEDSSDCVVLITRDRNSFTVND
jgi:hypothetical protein